MLALPKAGNHILNRNTAQMDVLRSLRNHIRRLPGWRDLIFAGSNALTATFFAPREQNFFVLNVPIWKQRLITSVLKEEGAKTVRFFQSKIKLGKLEKLVSTRENTVFVVWGRPDYDPFETIATKHDIPLWRIEDGFIRSKGLGAAHVLPKSLIIDRTGGIYFDATRPSALETYLATHKFTDEERAEASAMMADIIKRGITKYNLDEEPGHYQVDPDQENILVFGQYELDASIKYGSPEIKLNSELIEVAIAENPSAKIYYRPHPDITSGLRPAVSDVYQYAHRICIMDRPFPVWENIDRFTKVYVITSLAGFEAVMRGAQVHVLGLPFYAGWGVTEDRLNCIRRKRELNLEDVFCGSYLRQSNNNLNPNLVLRIGQYRP